MFSAPAAQTHSHELPHCTTAAQARELIEQTLRDDFAAEANAEPDDALQSDLDLPAILRLRAVLRYLEAIP